MDQARERLRVGADELGVSLSPGAAEQLLAYLDVMLAANERLNLTAIRDRDDALVRHLLDSLSIVPIWHDLAGAAPPSRLLDLGTGGGFPGAPLAVVWPETRALLIDGTGKKVRAVAECLAEAGIGNAEALQSRGADLPRVRPGSKGAFDLVVARAVSRSANVIHETWKLLAPGGRLLVMKGPEVGRDELGPAEEEARRRGLVPEPWRKTAVPGLERRTVLVYARRTELR